MIRHPLRVVTSSLVKELQNQFESRPNMYERMLAIVHAAALTTCYDAALEN